jgi:Fe2+ transport system protein FeoA
LNPPQRGNIVRVNGEDPALLRHLDDLGLIPGAQIEVIGHSQFDHNITVRIGDRSKVLGPPITGRVFVEINGQGGNPAAAAAASRGPQPEEGPS